MKQAYLTFRLKPRRTLPGQPRRVSRIDLLTTQNRWWVDSKGQWHDVSRIDPEYRRNLIAYLARNARRVQRAYLRGRVMGILFGYRIPSYSGDGPDPEDLEQVLAEITAERDLTAGRWLARQPLMRRLRYLERTRT